MDRSNLVLIGMPGSGKSTVGVLLAKRTMRDFIDTDVVIQACQGRSLQRIVDEEGYLALRRIEEKALLGLSLHHHVVATGGSAVYSDRAMNHLRSGGILIFLDADLATLDARIHDYGTRGLAKRPDQGLADLYQERLPLYRKHAEIAIQCQGLTHEEVTERIIEELSSR